MNIWSKSILIALLSAVVVYFFYGKEKKQKQLVRYNIHYTIRVTEDSSAGEHFLRAVVDQLEKRMEIAGWKYSIASASIEARTVYVTLLGIEDTLTPTAYLIANNRIQFREMYTMQDGRIVEMLKAIIDLMKEQTKKAIKKTPQVRDTANLSEEAKGLLENMEKGQEENLNKDELIQFASPYVDNQQRTIYPAEIGHVKIKDTQAVRNLFLTDKIRALAPPYMRISFGNPVKKKDLINEELLVPLYILNTWPDPFKAMLENEDIVESSVEFDINGKPEILLKFNKDAAKKWKLMTEKNVGRPLAIIINETVISAPNVLSAIEGGSAIITGNYTVDESKALSMALKAPILPVQLEIISTEVKKLEFKFSRMFKLVATLITFLIVGGLSFAAFKALKST